MIPDRAFMIVNGFFIFLQPYYYWRLFSKKRHVILSLMSITSVLTRMPCIDTFIFAHELSVKELPFDWLALASSK
jgi:hypothetical protein